MKAKLREDLDEALKALLEMVEQHCDVIGVTTDNRPVYHCEFFSSYFAIDVLIKHKIITRDQLENTNV